MLLFRTLDIYNCDRVIAFKFPAYLIRHPHKTLWVLHQYRQAYDLYNTDITNIPHNDRGINLRKCICAADNQSFAESQKVFVNSKITQQRMQHYNAYNPTVLPPPINDPEIFCGGPLGDYIFAGGRINSMKRQHLLVEALALAEPHVKMVIAGPPDTPEDEKRLLELTENLELKDRLRLDLRFLSRESYAEYMNNSLAVAYLPYDEDSSGYVALEGVSAGKAVLTTTDSGGVAELVKHGETGWVVSPDASALAKAMNDACNNKDLCNNYGTRARQAWLARNINWSSTIERLLA